MPVQQPPRNNDTIQEERQSQDQDMDASERSRQAYDDDQESEQMASSGHGGAKVFKYQTKFNRPFMEGEGPRDFNNSQNYNHKLTNYI
jgi:hypothetical protein